MRPLLVPAHRLALPLPDTNAWRYERPAHLPQNRSLIFTRVYKLNYLFVLGNFFGERLANATNALPSAFIVFQSIFRR